MGNFKLDGRKFKLTKEFVERLPLAERDEQGRVKQKLFWDERLTGFGVLVGLSKSFVVQRQVNGRTVRETLGKYGPRDWAVEQARKEAQQRLSALARGERQPKVPTITLQGAWTRIALPHLKKKQRSPVTIRVYQFNLDKYLSDWLHRPLAQITRTEARELHEKLAEDPGKQTADLAMKVFSAIYGRALKEHDLPVCPTVAVTFHEPEPPRSAIPVEKLPAWNAAIMRLTGGVQRDCLQFLLFSGLRKSSAWNIRWADIDLARKVVHIATVKGGKEFDLPMSRQMIQIVESRQREKDLYAATARCAPWLFASPTSKSGHLETLPVPKVPDLEWTIHDTRRTFITVGESAGVSIMAIKCLVNHVQPRGITGGYLNITPERLAPDMQIISDKLTTIIAGGATVTPIKQKRKA